MIRKGGRREKEEEEEGERSPPKLRPLSTITMVARLPRTGRAAAVLAAAAASLGSLLLLQPCRRDEGREWEGSTTPRPRPLLLLGRREEEMNQ